MNFDFDSITPRQNSSSYKWDISDDPKLLPMWVADMDFKTAPAIIEALEQRVRHGIFGYTKVPATYFSAIQHWFTTRHQFEIAREWILYTSGVVPALSAILRAVTNPGDKVLVQTPVYNCFFSSIRNMGSEILENPLIQIDGRFEMDFADLEQKASLPGVKALLLCNPHNPVGRAWTATELRRLGEICQRYKVLMISDEIHCDLVFPHQKHQPYATLGADFLAQSITCLSPSKTFNIAGLQIANIVVADPALRSRIDKALNIHEVCDVNPFGVTATIAAYTKGTEWLDALRHYLYENYLLVEDFLSRELPALRLTKQEATYLAWIDCRSLGVCSAVMTQQLSEKAHLRVNEGTLYGGAGEGFIRLNIACPRQVLTEGLVRLKSGLNVISSSDKSLSLI
ncbi:MalY/PatB family protein [uncultured Tolumonas sp.]|uniref:MalY/PatB family protein n=1 Tax=uncultured Tolumonas sp. TaxID=263765 RepID=UPI002A0A7B53|nr:MalY/PatB family protein [uncultured Tolumonas sp.]